MPPGYQFCCQKKRKCSSALVQKIGILNFAPFLLVPLSLTLFCMSHVLLSICLMVHVECFEWIFDNCVTLTVCLLFFISVSMSYHFSLTVLICLFVCPDVCDSWAIDIKCKQKSIIDSCTTLDEDYIPFCYSPKMDQSYSTCFGAFIQYSCQLN